MEDTDHYPYYVVTPISQISPIYKEKYLDRGIPHDIIRQLNYIIGGT